MQENKFGLNAGRVTINGTEVFQVTDVWLHSKPGNQTEITLSFDASSQDVAYSEPQTQQPE